MKVAELQSYLFLTHPVNGMQPAFIPLVVFKSFHSM